MTDRDRIAWLYRRVGFGLAPGQLDELEALGVDRAIDQLVDPDGNGVPPAPDPWASLDFSSYRPDSGNGDLVRATISAWLTAMATTPRPFEEWVRWFWHGHFVSTIQVVRHPGLLVQQLRTLGRLGLGDFRTLLRAVTVDPAMLIYLDGAENRKGAVNENYGRELLELFALGVGNYHEDDVRAGAEALTGWVVDRDTGKAVFVAARHDDTPRRFLGRDGVRDVDGVIDAVVAHEACANWITHELGKAILGPEVDHGLIVQLADRFRSSGLQLRPLLRQMLEAGVDGAATTVVQAPVPWLAGALRATQVPVAQAVSLVRSELKTAGQVPLAAPNVAGWPGMRTWLSASATVARFNMAAALASLAAPAERTAPNRDLVAAAEGIGGGGPDSPQLADLADLLGVPAGFSPATRAALTGLGRDLPAGERRAVAVLTVALASSDLVVDRGPT